MGPTEVVIQDPCPSDSPVILTGAYMCAGYPHGLQGTVVHGVAGKGLNPSHNHDSHYMTAMESMELPSKKIDA